VVTEDGRAQDLVQFSFVDIPVPPPTPSGTSGEAATVRSDVVTNANPLDSRLYAIVLDGFHVDPSRSTVVRKLARQFIEHSMGPNDLGAVLLLGEVRANQPFTSNKSLLLSAVDQFIGRKSGSPMSSMMNDALLRPPEAGSPEDAESGARANEARIVFESIKQLCDRLGTTQGHRRAVVLFGEGVDFDTSDLIGEDKRPGAGGQGLKYEPAKHAGTILQAEQDLFVAARRANVAIYAVDPRGNTMGEENMMQASSAPGLGFIRETQRSQGTLRTFASETGGLAVVNTANIATGFAHIVQANSSYYVLAYNPSNVARDGAYHKISVTVNRPDVDVTARKGYFAPLDTKGPAATAPPAATPAVSANAASSRMRDLLASQLPVSGLGLEVTGGPVRSQGDKVLVALVVEIDTKGLPFTEANGQLSNDIEIGFLAVDSMGKTQAANRSVGNLRLPAAQRSAVDGGLRYVVEFPVSPGHYQVRAAAHESAGDGGGSAILDVDALRLDPAKTPLSIGTILLTTTGAGAVPTTGSYPLLKSLLPAPPTSSRSFTNRDTLVAFADVCDSQPGQTDKVDITTMVQTADGHEVWRSTVTKDSADLALKKNGYGHLSEIPLSSVAPGRYVLTIAAKSTTGKTASNAILFVVR
jgi:VWFA-related protein